MPNSICAYVLAGDPTYLAASLASYYDLVDRIILSYDEQGLGWAGDPIPVQACIDQARAMDHKGKLELLAGRFSDPSKPPLACETIQRQAGLMAARGADWIVQLDGDEIMTDPATFQECLEAAEACGATGLEYPSRWLYARVAGNRCLETSRRFWGIAASYPGPLAVRGDAHLTLARQCGGQKYHVDFRSRNTDPWRDRRTRVDRVIRPASAVFHFSWVRARTELEQKARISGHSNDYDWGRRIDAWEKRQRHPIAAVVGTPWRPRTHHDRLRLSSIRVTPEMLLRSDGDKEPSL